MGKKTFRLNNDIQELEEPVDSELELFRMNKWLKINYPKVKKEYEREDKEEREMTNVHIKE